MKRLFAALLLAGCATTSPPWTQTTVAESYEPDSEEGYSCAARCDAMPNVQEKTACRQACEEKHGGTFTPAQQERCTETGTKITCEPIQ